MRPSQLLVAALATAGLGASALATDFSFAGNLSRDDDVLAFQFTVGLPSTVTLLTYSWAGGVNAAGQTIAGGGFDPILSLYDSTGAKIGFNDDGGTGVVPVDAVDNRPWDTFFQATLAPGVYRVTVTQFNNFGPEVFGDPSQRAGDPSFTGTSCGVPGGQFLTVGGNFCDQRDSHWAFDVLNVGEAVVINPGLPEPATWVLAIVGFGLVGGVARRRRAALATA